MAYYARRSQGESTNPRRPRHATPLELTCNQGGTVRLRASVLFPLDVPASQDVMVLRPPPHPSGASGAAFRVINLRPATLSLGAGVGAGAGAVRGGGGAVRVKEAAVPDIVITATV